METMDDGDDGQEDKSKSTSFTSHPRSIIMASLKAGTSAAARMLSRRGVAALQSCPVAAVRYNSSAHASSSKSSSSSPNVPPSLAALTSNAPKQPNSRIKPAVDTFFTGKPLYTSLLIELEDLADRSKRSLQQNFILDAKTRVPAFEDMLRYEETLRQQRGPDTLIPLWAATSASGAVRSSPWLSRADMQSLVGMPLKTSQYRQVTNGLALLARYHALIELHLRGLGGSYRELAAQVEEKLNRFSRQRYEGEGLGDGMVSRSGVDAEGRIWAVGRRKESTAMVYIAPASNLVQPSPSGSSQADSDSAFGEIQINASSIGTFFTRQAHREQIVHPLRLTGLLGQFNVFALTHGGGLSGQAGATAHGVAKAIVRWFQQKHRDLSTAPEASEEEIQTWKTMSDSVREVLIRDGVFKRDPRQVERKKTGLAKARKAYTWVKR